MISWIFQSCSRTLGIFSKWNDEMTYFQLAISTLALGNENCVTWETATSATDFCLFLLPVCVVCKCVIVSCLAITHVWNLGCACGVERLAFASSGSGTGLLEGAPWGVRGSGSLLASILANPQHSDPWMFTLFPWNEINHLFAILPIFNTRLHNFPWWRSQERPKEAKPWLQFRSGKEELHGHEISMWIGSAFLNLFCGRVKLTAFLFSSSCFLDGERRSELCPSVPFMQSTREV